MGPIHANKSYSGLVDQLDQNNTAQLLLLCVHIYQTKAIIMFIMKIILIKAVAIAYQYNNLEKAFGGLFRINQCQNTILQPEPLHSEVL